MLQTPLTTRQVVHRVVLALLKSCEKELLGADFGGVNAIVRVLPKRVEKGEIAVDELMKEAFRFTLKRAQLLEIETRLEAENASG
jgi:hypothetical protein